MNTKITQRTYANQEQLTISREYVLFRFKYIPNPILAISDTSDIQYHFKNYREGKRVIQELFKLNRSWRPAYISLTKLAQRSLCSVRTVQRVLTKLRELGLINWSTQFKEMNVYKFHSFLDLPHVRNQLGKWLAASLNELRLLSLYSCPAFISKTIRKWAFNNSFRSVYKTSVQLLILKEDYIYKKRAVRACSSPTRGGLEEARGLTWAESLVKAVPPISIPAHECNTDVNAMSYEDLDTILSKAPASVAPTTEQAAQALKRESVEVDRPIPTNTSLNEVSNKQKREIHGSKLIQSNPDVCTRDKRDQVNQLGTDKTVGISARSDSRGAWGVAPKPEGFKSFRTALQSGIRSLQNAWSTDQLHQSGSPEKGVSDAPRCQDDRAYDSCARGTKNADS